MLVVCSNRPDIVSKGGENIFDFKKIGKHVADLSKLPLIFHFD
jgi:hypothetical protein